MLFIIYHRKNHWNHWKILYFHNKVKTPLYGHKLNKDTSLRTVCFVPGKESLYDNVEKTGTSHRGTSTMVFSHSEGTLTALITTNRSHYKMNAI